MTRPTARPTGRRSSNHRLWLVTPGTTPERFETAGTSRADIALLDLEDSVPPADKDTARFAVLDFLHRADGQDGDGAAVWGIRINAPDTVPGLRDLVALAEARACPAVLLVPKVESARDVELVARVVDPDHTGRTRIWALIETPRAVGDLREILRAPALAGVLFGAADYAAAAGCKLTRSALRHPRQVLVAAAAAAGLPAVDSPWFALDDTDGLRKDADDAVDLGFSGKVAVHPRQLAVIRAAFDPDPLELAAARAVVGAATASRGSITTVDGSMVGPPLVAAARALTLRAGDAPAPTSGGPRRG